MSNHFQVGLDATDEVGAGGAELLHQLLQLPLEFVADGDESEFSSLRFALLSLREERADEVVLTLVHESLERRVQRVVVLLDEFGSLVANSTGEMPYEKTVVVSDFSVFSQLGLSGQSKSEVGPIA